MRPSLGSRCCCAERHAQCCWPTAVALSSHCVPLQTQCAFQTTPFATQMAKTRSTCGSGRTAFMYRAVGNDNEQQATMSETTYQKWNMTLFPHQTSNMPCHGAETDLCAHSHRPATWHLLHPRTRSSWAQARPPLPSFARGAPVSSPSLLALLPCHAR